MLQRLLSLLLLPVLLLSPVPAEAEATPCVRLPVVMYHHISENARQWNDYVVSPAEFEADLRWLRAHGYETVSLQELLDWQAGNLALPEKPCMITFDDGFESTRRYAEPLLAQYGFCGVVAVIGAVCEKFSQVEATDPDTDNLSWEEVEEMARRGVIEAQCHTWDLHRLYPRKGCGRKKGEETQAYRQMLTADLERFLRTAEERGVTILPAIAYPYGSHCQETVAVIKELGFRAAFTCAEKVNLLTGDPEELYDLGRCNRPHGADSEKFFGKWEENS